MPIFNLYYTMFPTNYLLLKDQFVESLTTVALMLKIC